MQAGFDVIWSNEYDPWFVRGYEYGMSCLNINGSNHRIYNTSSIVTVGPNQIAKEAFHNTPLPETFGIIRGYHVLTFLLEEKIVEEKVKMGNYQRFM